MPSDRDFSALKPESGAPVELEPTSHPLAIEQREGITMDRDLDDPSFVGYLDELCAQANAVREFAG